MSKTQKPPRKCRGLGNNVGGVNGKDFVKSHCCSKEEIRLRKQVQSVLGKKIQGKDFKSRLLMDEDQAKEEQLVTCSELE
jgi:hypothetical protein